MRRWKGDSGSVKLWAMFQCPVGKPSTGNGIHADLTLTHTTYLNIVSDQVRTFMTVVFFDGSGLVQHITPFVTLQKNVQND